MRRTILCLAMLCLGSCGVTTLHQARDQARTDISACQGTYPLARGSLALRLHCEDVAVLAYARWLAPADTNTIARYAAAVEQQAREVDQGQLSMPAWWAFVGQERTVLAPARDDRAMSLLAMSPAPAAERTTS